MLRWNVIVHIDAVAEREAALLHLRHVLEVGAEPVIHALQRVDPVAVLPNVVEHFLVLELLVCYQFRLQRRGLSEHFVQGFADLQVYLNGERLVNVSFEDVLLVRFVQRHLSLTCKLFYLVAVAVYILQFALDFYEAHIV